MSQSDLTSETKTDFPHPSFSWLWITGARAASEPFSLLYFGMWEGDNSSKWEREQKHKPWAFTRWQWGTMSDTARRRVKNNLHYEMSNFPHLPANYSHAGTLDWCDRSFLRKVMGAGGVTEGWQGNNHRSNCWWWLASSERSWFAVLIPSVSPVCNVQVENLQD